MVILHISTKEIKQQWMYQKQSCILFIYTWSGLSQMMWAAGFVANEPVQKH